MLSVLKAAKMCPVTEAISCSYLQDCQCKECFLYLDYYGKNALEFWP